MMTAIPLPLSDTPAAPAASQALLIARSWALATLGSSTFAASIFLTQPATALPPIVHHVASLPLAMLTLAVFGIPSLWILLQLSGTQYSLAESNQNFAEAAGHAGMCLLGLTPLMFLYGITGPAAGVVLRILLHLALLLASYAFARAALPATLWRASTPLGQTVISIFVLLYLTLVLKHAL